MLIDTLGEYSNAQALTGTALSTNVVDHGAANQIGVGSSLYVHFNVVVAADFTTGDETYSFAFETSAVAAITSSVILCTRAILAATLVVGYKFSMAVPPDGMLRYSGVRYTLAGTTPTLTIDAHLSSQSPTAWAALPDAI